MVPRLIASAVVAGTLAVLGTGYGVECGDPFPARKPLPTPAAPTLGACRFAPQLEMLPMPGRPSRDVGSVYSQENYLRQQLALRSAELADCAKLYAEPGADQLARVTVGETGLVRDIEVQGPFVSEALTGCVESKATRWTFRAGPAAFVLTLPVQYCPGS